MSDSTRGKVGKTEQTKFPVIQERYWFIEVVSEVERGIEQSAVVVEINGGQKDDGVVTWSDN